MSNKRTTIVVRRATPEEVEPAAVLCVEAFRAFNTSVGHDEEFPNGAPPVAILRHTQEHPDMALFVAVVVDDEGDGGGRVVGTSSIDLRDSVGAIGPVAVSPQVWSGGVGRRLMEACIEAAEARGKRVIMLVQVAANAASFSLYARLGFVPTENLLNFVGLVDPVSGKAGLDLDAYSCRRLTAADAPACDALFQQAMAPPHPPGTFSRLRELEGMLAQGGPTVYGLWAAGSLVAYTTGTVLGGHSVASCTEAFQALLYHISQKLREEAQGQGGPTTSTPTTEELNFYVHGRLYPELLPWLFQKAKLRLVRQLTGMAYGPPPHPVVCPQPAASPRMIYCPSIYY